MRNPGLIKKYMTTTCAIINICTRPKLKLLNIYHDYVSFSVHVKYISNLVDPAFTENLVWGWFVPM